MPLPPELPSEAPPPVPHRSPSAPDPIEETGDQGWLYQMGIRGDWTAASFERLTALFLEPPDRDTWSMALWAIERCPEPGTVDVLVRFVQGRAATHDRTLAASALGGVRNPRAVPALRSLLTGTEEEIRAAAVRAVMARSTWDPEARYLLDEIMSAPDLRGLLDAEGATGALADR